MNKSKPKLHKKRKLNKRRVLLYVLTLFFLTSSIYNSLHFKRLKSLNHFKNNETLPMSQHELSRGNSNYNDYYRTHGEGENISIKDNIRNKYTYKIIIDPGHGGYDEGSSSIDKKTREKDVVLKIARYTKEYLESYGCTVILTRDEDKAIKNAINEKQDLNAREKIVNSSEAQVFISLHTNYSPDASYNGITAYTNSPNGFQKYEREKLSDSILSEIKKSDTWKIRETSHDSLYLLKKSKIPCVLMECGFISNKDDKNKLTDDVSLRILSQNIGNGIINYFK